MVTGKDPAGARILVLDDVFTSGSTVNECAGVLKVSGAARVHVLAVARALGGPGGTDVRRSPSLSGS